LIFNSYPSLILFNSLTIRIRILLIRIQILILLQFLNGHLTFFHRLHGNLLTVFFHFLLLKKFMIMMIVLFLIF